MQEFRRQRTIRFCCPINHLLGRLCFFELVALQADRSAGKLALIHADTNVRLYSCTSRNPDNNINQCSDVYNCSWPGRIRMPRHFSGKIQAKGWIFASLPIFLSEHLCIFVETLLQSVLYVELEGDAVHTPNDCACEPV